jgi:hypothetical protein
VERQSPRGKNIALIFEKTSTGNGNGTGGETGGDIARRRGSYDIMGRVSALILVSARLSLGRLHGQLDYDSVPPRSRDEVRASMATASHVRSTIDSSSRRRLDGPSGISG